MFKKVDFIIFLNSVEIHNRVEVTYPDITHII